MGPELERRLQQSAGLEALIAGADLPAEAVTCAGLVSLAVARGANSLALRLGEAAAAGGAGNRVPYIEIARAAAGIAAGRDLGQTPAAEERAEAAGTARATLEGVLPQLTSAARAGEAPGAMVRRMLSEWQLSPDFASLRDEAALAALEKGEADAWREFWADVRSLAAEYGLD